MLPRILHYHRQAMRNYHLSTQQLANLQTRKLRHLLDHAFHHVPLYHRWFRSRGLTPEDIRTTDDLRRLPTLERHEIRANSPTGITDSTNRSRGADVRRTSGATGPPPRHP